MKAKFLFAIAIGISIFALIVAVQGTFTKKRSSTPYVGSYVFDGDQNTTMDVKIQGGHYEVALSGGGNETAVVAADCFIRAVGTLKGHQLVAAFNAVETDTFSYSEQASRKEARQLKVVFGSEGAFVERADTLGYCGLGATFEGQYRLKPEK